MEIHTTQEGLNMDSTEPKIMFYCILRFCRKIILLYFISHAWYANTEVITLLCIFLRANCAIHWPIFVFTNNKIYFLIDIEIFTVRIQYFLLYKYYWYILVVNYIFNFINGGQFDADYEASWSFSIIGQRFILIQPKS